MRMNRVLRLAVALLPAALAFAAPLFAQSGTPVPHRLTADGMASPATPLLWDAGGIVVARPGALVNDGGQARVATERWRIDPATGTARRIAADEPWTRRAGSGAAGGRRVYVVNPESLEPELWLANADGSNARLLLRGESEYFFDPVISPDGRRFVFVRAPTGSETHAHGAIWLGDIASGDLRLFVAQATAPVWSPDGTQLAFEHWGDVYVLGVGAPVPTWPDWRRRAVGGAGAASAPASPEALTPPAVIRVRHAQGNYDWSQTYTCRPPALPVGTIMTIPFETYVSWVLPIEASPSNPPEHLKAQAVAARTYAWKRVNFNNAWDVSDWTDTQAMCDLRADPRTDAAAAATAGQYIAYLGNLIAALYGAEGGDPTTKDPFGCGAPCAYLDAVDDPVSFRQTVSGHGAGLSQKGSQRWAGWHGWNYVQILTHYYSKVTLEGPTTFGSLHAPWKGWYQSSNRVRIAGTANNGGAFNIFAVGAGLTGAQIATNTTLAVLDLSAIPEQALGSLVISATLGGARVATQTIGLDRLLPTGTVSVPTTTTVPTLTLLLNGSDAGPSGYAGYGLSYGWVWEGEDKVSQCCVYGAGQIVNDADALNGKAIFAPAGAGGVWYGPYTYAVPPGSAYRAYFRLKVGNNLASNEIGKIDVVADGWNPIGIKRIAGTDFRAANKYQEFYVDVDYVDAATMGMEFRVDFPGVTDLWLDRVLVATYPNSASAPVTWVLGGSPGGKRSLIAKFSDGAGNVSNDVAVVVAYEWAKKLFLPMLVR